MAETHWGIVPDVWEDFVQTTNNEYFRYLMGDPGATKMRRVDESIRMNSKGSWMWGTDDHLLVEPETGSTDWKPQGQLYISSGQAPKVRGRAFEKTKLYVTGTYADNRIVGGEYLMATGRRRRRLGALVAMSVVEDKIGWVPEGRVIVKVLRSVLARCKEKREELLELSGKGSQKAKDEGLEQVAGMELMVYRCMNKLMN